MVKNLQIYVFDMGRVITKSANLGMFYKEAKMRCDYADFRKQFYNSQASDDVYKGIITDDEFFCYLKVVCGTKLSVSELKNLYTLSKGGIYDDTVRIIHNLKNRGNSVYLLSNLKQIDYDYLNEHVDLSVFDQMFLSYRLGMSKPHEDIYRHVIETLGTNDFHFFDDSEENIEAAEKLGILAHQVTGEDIKKCLKLKI